MKSLSLALESESIPDKFSQPHYANNKKLKDLLKRSSEVNAIVDSDKTFWSIVFEGKTKGELIPTKEKFEILILTTRLGMQYKEIKNIFGQSVRVVIGYFSI